MTENVVLTPEEAKALPDGQWVQDASGQAYCLIDTHMGWPQRMAMFKRSLKSLDSIEYPLHLADFQGDCEHKWGSHDLGHCVRCGVVVAEPRPMFFDAETHDVIRAAAAHNAHLEAQTGEPS